MQGRSSEPGRASKSVRQASIDSEAGAQKISSGRSAMPTNGRAHFCCAPGSEDLADELASLVAGSWESVNWVHGVMIMANGATVPRDLPEHASPAARSWWSASVTNNLRTRRN